MLDIHFHLDYEQNFGHPIMTTYHYWLHPWPILNALLKVHRYRSAIG
jgi:hypothetical protein